MKFLKCAMWFIKEYAMVGVAVALFLLIGLQIEKQYRDVRYMGNCINEQGWKQYGAIIKKPYDTEELRYITNICQVHKTDEPEVFDYFKGRLFKYVGE